MATKKFIIEVEEGITKCDLSCPHKVNGNCIDPECYIENVWDIFNCAKYNLATMKIKESLSREELREFANQYSHNIWRQLMQRFEEDDKFYIGANDVSDYILNAILDTYQKMMEEENESK